MRYKSREAMSREEVPTVTSASAKGLGRLRWERKEAQTRQETEGTQAVDLWAVHPGGRSILDAVQRSLQLDSGALAPSRAVLRESGNMSSATLLFVLAKILEDAQRGERGCAMAFGPGLTTETMLFQAA